MLGRSHLQIWFYSIILFHGLGSPPCRLNTEKTPFPCPNMLWSLHPHQLGGRGLCCCDKQLCSLWVKRVLERPLPHILSAHCLEGNTFGQLPDTIPCCAVLQSFTIALLCRREPGTWPQPFPKLPTLCWGFQELLCSGPSGGASSPFYPKMHASGKRSVPLCLASTKSMGSMKAIWCHERDEQGNGVGWLLAAGKGVGQLGSLEEQEVLEPYDFF